MRQLYGEPVNLRKTLLKMCLILVGKQMQNANGLDLNELLMGLNDVSKSETFNLGRSLEKVPAFTR